ncbi:MAG: chorismate lyase [Cyanobacteria bacterium P01_E01_bin.34]
MTATSPPPETLRSIAPSGWWQLDCVWEAKTLDLQKKTFAPPIPPAWRLLLLNDGYNTRNLGLITGEDIAATMIGTTAIAPAALESGLSEAPAAVSLLDTPNLRRQVMLRTASGTPLAYGVSWWNDDCMRSHLRHPEQPIGRDLSLHRTELYRELHGLYLGHSDELEREFGVEGPFWGRHYVLWHHQHPLTVIVEVFSNLLTRYLGPNTIKQ